MSKLAKALSGAAGNAGGGSLYVEDVFSTFLYSGTDATQVITNGVDMTEGGLVWCKTRATNSNHVLVDSEFSMNNADKNFVSSSTSTAATTGPAIDSFNSTGFTLSSNWYANYAGYGTYVSWSFRKAEKFFDVVTYTGDGTAGREISHSLDSIPQAIIVKRTDTSANWVMYHWRLGNDAGIVLNTASSGGSEKVLNNTTPTSTVFAVTNSAEINASGGTYVAYLFAEEAAFGGDEDEYICSVDRYNGNGSTKIVNLGFEPQWLLVKKTNSTGGAADWIIVDSMRGITSGGNDAFLAPNSSAAEIDVNAFELTATGFTVATSDYRVNTNNVSYIFIAIRRPMKTPTAGTEVFTADTRGSTGDGVNPTYRSAWPVDMALLRNVGYSSASTMLTPRLTGSQYMYANQTYAEAAANTVVVWDFMNGWYNDTGTNTAQVSWMFRRATGFMDVVCFTGDSGNTNQRVLHNLTVAPELIIYKGRNKVNYWRVYAGRIDQYTVLNLNNPATTWAGFWGTSAPTATDFGFNPSLMDLDAYNAVAYLFATLAGVSKVGTYTGTGADLNVDCGFTGGARFILIKRTEASGDWYYWDYLRGISVGSDPYSILNTESAQVTGTDYVDPLNAGFTVTSSASSTVNINGGTYIFLAIA
jgi:hypothetical protein